MTPTQMAWAQARNQLAAALLALGYPEELADLLAFADGAFATGSDGAVSPFEGENVTVHQVEDKLENAKIRSPLLSGIKGNLGKYIVRGAKAIIYITGRQRKAK